MHTGQNDSTSPTLCTAATTTPRPRNLDFLHSPVAIQAAKDLSSHTDPLADLELASSILADVRHLANDFVAGNNMFGFENTEVSVRFPLENQLTADSLDKGPHPPVTVCTSLPQTPQ